MTGTLGRSSRIPTEVMIQIVSSAPDLTTLHHLTLASPRVFRIFNRYGMSILESVMANDTPPEIQCLVRLVAQVHACTPETPMAWTYKEFLEKYIACRSETSDLDHDIDDSLAELEPFAGTPLAEIGGEFAYSPREILLLHRQVAILSEACIEFFQESCRLHVPTPIDDAAFCPEDRPCRQIDYGPPSWTETQRMKRGLWRFQLHHEVSDAVRSGHVNWRSADGEEIPLLCPHEFYKSWVSQQWEVHAVGACLFKNLCHSVEEFAKPYHYCLLGDDNQSPHNSTCLRDIILNRALEWPATPQRPQSSRFKNPKERIQGAPHGHYFLSLLNEFLAIFVQHPFSIMPPVKFGFFAELGLAIWDNKRLSPMGLVISEWTSEDAVAMPHGLAEVQLFAWRSLRRNENITELYMRFLRDVLDVVIEQSSDEPL